MRKSLKAAALASVCLAPLAAYAADDTGFDMPEAPPNTQALKDISGQESETTYNQVDVGLRGQSSQSAVFGRYNGMYNTGPDVVAGWRLRNAKDWKGDNTYYYDFTGRDLSLGAGDHFDLAPNSSVNLRVGQQGTWGLALGWDAFTYVQSNNFKTAYNSDGTLLNGLNQFHATGANAGAVSTALNNYYNRTLVPALQTDTIGTRRDKGLVGLNYTFNEWTVSGGFTHEHKEGTMEQSADLATNVAFPQPINYDTDRFDAAAAYNTRRFQAKLTYNFSKFTDNNSQVDLTGLYYKRQGANTTWYGPGVYSLPPDNLAHQLGAQLGYNLSPVTRLNANLSYGIQMQDQSFVDPTLNPHTSLYPVGNAALGNNPSSLGGFVQTMFANVGMTTRPMPKADLRVSYTIDARQSNTGSYYGIVGTRLDQVASNTVGNTFTYRNALPESFIKQTALIEGGYKVLDSTKVTLGYTWNGVDRTEALVDHTSESVLSAKARTTLASDLVNNLGYSYSDRNASNPDYSIWTNLVNHGGDCGQTNGGNTVDCPQIPYYEAPRIQHAIKERLTKTFGTDLSTSLVTSFAHDHYPVSYGRTADYKITAGPDIGYTIGHDGEAHAFYTFERSYNTFNDNSVANPFAHQNKNWTETTTADTHTVGAGGSYRVSPKLKLGSDYIFSYGMSAFDANGAMGQAICPVCDQLPDNTTMLNSFKLHGEYEWEPGVTIYLGYAFDRFMSNDWGLWGTPHVTTTGTTSPSGFLTNEGNPSYAVHSVITRVSFKW